MQLRPFEVKEKRYTITQEEQEDETVTMPFFKMYVKLRNKFNPMRLILGEEKFACFAEGKQPKSYIDAIDYFMDKMDLDIKDIKFTNK